MPDYPVPAQYVRRCVYIACFATTLVYALSMLLLLLCLSVAAKFYIVVSQDVVTVAQLLYLKCMHVLVETSIYVACYSHRGIRQHVCAFILTLMFHLYYERNGDAQEILLALLSKIFISDVTKK